MSGLEGSRALYSNLLPSVVTGESSVVAIHNYLFEAVIVLIVQSVLIVLIELSSCS